MSITKNVANKAPAKKTKRFHSSNAVRDLVWILAGGHCELCGINLTVDLRIGKKMRWGEVAHILPASPQGPRAEPGHDAKQAAALTDDAGNLLLACPNCHEQIDKDADGYPKTDLGEFQRRHRDAVNLAGSAAANFRAVPLIFLSQHFRTLNKIQNTDLLSAMLAEGLSAVVEPRVIVLNEPLSSGRDAAYWLSVTDKIKSELATNLRKHSNGFGDPPMLAVVGLADIPALIMLGQTIGDRFKRMTFSPSRASGLQWPDKTAAAPQFRYIRPPSGDGPIAFVLSLSAKVPERDVQAAISDVRIAELSIGAPSTSMMRSRAVIDAFRDALQTPLSELEAETPAPISVFAAIPAALAIEFGAFLTMQHRHPYVVYDRANDGSFQPALRLGHHKDPQR